MAFSENIIDLKCPICLRRFHDPIILNCGHTFDRICIQQSSRSIGSNRCPLCNSKFDPTNGLITDKSLINLIQYVPTFEYFLIDIKSQQQKNDVLTFLQRVFDKRDVFETDYVVFQSQDTTIELNPKTKFDQEWNLKSVSNLNSMIQKACIDLQQRNGLRKICILTDGLTKHIRLTKIDSNIINQRVIVHIGEKNALRTRQIADEIDFRFEHFNEKTLDNYVEHFIKNF
ncbi:unnamed protein product [Rotaria magnacalcarata]|uniref:RING-type domain-containing protein n=2 Tax=Rotaria magnacalcarata TaxID=392030 RepID=A0A816QRY1_9BILA|nr:unnamed protein product [Rotaria magnacalcarata]CAF2064394.1 unnamed protein product [Rotaria magnacalcarata]CAF4367853.1 unnamed protein product [Rotaria magnacalcarata]